MPDGGGLTSEADAGAPPRERVHDNFFRGVSYNELMIRVQIADRRQAGGGRSWLTFKATDNPDLINGSFTQISGNANNDFWAAMPQTIQSMVATIMTFCLAALLELSRALERRPIHLPPPTPFNPTGDDYPRRWVRPRRGLGI